MAKEWAGPQGENGGCPRKRMQRGSDCPGDQQGSSSEGSELHQIRSVVPPKVSSRPSTPRSSNNTDLPCTVRSQFGIPPFVRSLFRYVPGMMYLYRQTIYWRQDIVWYVFELPHTWIRGLAEKVSKSGSSYRVLGLTPEPALTGERKTRQEDCTQRSRRYAHT